MSHRISLKFINVAVFCVMWFVSINIYHLSFAPQVKVLLETWQTLQTTTEELANKMSEVPKQSEPNIEELDKVFSEMKELFAKKKELVSAV